MLKMYLLFDHLCPESSNDAGDSTAHNGRPVQVKEEEEEIQEQPAAKRRRGKSKSQTKTEEMPKEEIKNEGNVDLILFLSLHVMQNMVKLLMTVGTVTSL